MVKKVLVDEVRTLGGVQVRVLVERVFDMTGEQDYLMDEARVSADLTGCGELEVHAFAGHYFLPLGRQDAEVGHHRFDDRYIVKTNDEVLLRAWWTPTLAESMLASYDPNVTEPFALWFEPGTVELRSRRPVPHDGAASLFPIKASVEGDQPVMVARLAEAAAAVASIVGRGQELAGEWRQHLARLGEVELAGPAWRTDAAFALRGEHARTRFEVDFPWALPWLGRAGLRTRVRVLRGLGMTGAVWNRHLPRAQRPRWRDLDVGRGGGPAPTQVRVAPPWDAAVDTGPDWAALLPLLARARVDWMVATAAEVRLGWEQLLPDAALIEAVVPGLVRLCEATAPAAPYR